MRLDGFEDLGGAAATELAGGGSTELDKVGGDGFAVVHCVECSDLGAYAFSSYVFNPIQDELDLPRKLSSWACPTTWQQRS